MKTSKLVIFLMALLLLTGTAIAFGLLINQWILWSYLIFIGVSSLIGLVLYLITKNKGKSVDLEEPRSKKKVKLTPEIHLKKIDDKLFKGDLDRCSKWADNVEEIIDEYPSMLGSEGVETPIYTINFYGRNFNDGLGKAEYWSFCNMADGRMPIGLIQKRDGISEEDFQKKIKGIQNTLADSPQYVDTEEVKLSEDEFGRPVRTIRKRKETKDEQIKRQESEAEERAESLGGKD